jgi:hypothetical protein
MANPTIAAKAKSNLRLVPDAGGVKSAGLRLGGLAPSVEMTHGKYTVACEGAWVESDRQRHPGRIAISCF